MSARTTKRRGRGEGSIFQRPNGSWCAAIAAGQDAQGKRIRKYVTGETKSEVKDKLTKLQSSKLDGTLCDAGKQTVGQYLDTWLDTCARPTLCSSTYSSYSIAVNKHIKPRAGRISLAKLTPLHVQSMYSEMEKGGVSQDRRRLSHVVLRRALKQAVKWGLVPRNVCDAVERPRTPKYEIHPLTTENAIKLLNAAKGDRMEAITVLAVTCGLRLGELFALAWDSIDFKNRTLFVKHTLLEVSGKLSLKEPKTAKSRRRIELPQMAIDALQERRRLMVTEGLAGCPWVFPNHHGTWLRRSHFHAEYFTPLLKKAGLPPMRFHDLRHTSATILLVQGVHPKVVQERLGHSQISVTLDTYSHVLPSMQRDAASQFDSVFSQKAENGCALAAPA